MADIGDLSATITLDTSPYLAGLDSLTSSTESTTKAIADLWVEVSSPILDLTEWQTGLDEMTASTQEATDQILANWKTISTPVVDPTGVTDPVTAMTGIVNDETGKMKIALASITNPMLNTGGITEPMLQLTSQVEADTTAIKGNFESIGTTAQLALGDGIMTVATEVETQTAKMQEEFLSLSDGMKSDFSTASTAIEGEIVGIGNTFKETIGTMQEEKDNFNATPLNTSSSGGSTPTSSTNPTLSSVSSDAVSLGKDILFPTIAAGGAGLYEAYTQSKASNAFASDTFKDPSYTAQANNLSTQISSSTGTDFADVMGGLRQTVNEFNGNISAANAGNIVQNAAMLAAPQGGSVTSTADTLATLMKEFHVDPSNVKATAEFTSQMGQAMADSKATLQQFNGAIGQSAQLAGEFGLKFPDVASAFSVLTTAGNTPDEAGTKLKDLIQQASNGASGAQKNALADLGNVSGVTNLSQDFTPQGLAKVGLSGLIKDITEISSPENVAKYAAAAKTARTPEMANILYSAGQSSLGTLSQIFPDTRTAAGALSLEQASGPQGSMAATQKNINGSGNSGEVKSQFDAYASSPEGSINKLATSVKNAAASIGTSLAPSLKSLAKDIDEILTKFDSWSSKNPDTLAGILKVSLGIGGFLLGMGTLGKIIGFVAGVLVGIISVFQAVGTALAVIIATVALTLGVPAEVAAAIVAAIAILIAAIIYGIVQLVTHWNQVVSWFKGIIGDIGGFFTGLKGNIGGVLMDIGHSFDNFLLTASDMGVKISGAIGGWFNSLVPSIGGVIDNAKKLFSTFMGDVSQWGYNMINMIGQGIQKGMNLLPAPLKAAANMVVNFLGIFSPAKEGPLSTADKWMPNLFNMFVGDINANSPKLKGALSSALSGITASGSILSASVPVGASTASVQNSRVVNAPITNNFNGSANSWQTQQQMKSIFSPANLSKLAYY